MKARSPWMARPMPQKRPGIEAAAAGLPSSTIPMSTKARLTIAQTPEVPVEARAACAGSTRRARRRRRRGASCRARRSRLASRRTSGSTPTSRATASRSSKPSAVGALRLLLLDGAGEHLAHLVRRVALGERARSRASARRARPPAPRRGCAGASPLTAASSARTSVVHRGEAIVGPLLERAQHDGLRPPARHAGAPRAARRRDSSVRIEATTASASPAPRHGRLAGEQLVGDHAPGELVGAAVERVAADLLGRHVDRRAHLDALRGERRRARAPGSARWDRRAPAARRAMPKSSTFTTPSSRTITFSGLMSRWTRPAPVRRGERAARRRRASRRAWRRARRRRPSTSRSVRPGDELHDDVRRAVVLADVEDGDGVRVIERRRGARLAEEAGRRPSPRWRVAVGDDLERDAPLEPRVVGAVDAAHAALPEDGLDGVALEGVARLEHRRGRGSGSRAPARPVAVE